MIKLLLILFPFLLLFGEETAFLLPDEQSRLTHTLSKVIKHTSNECLIQTPSLNHPDLKKALQYAASRRHNVTLIVQDLKGDPLSLVQYEGVNLFFYNARKLHGTVILIDDHYACTLPIPLDKERFSGDTSIALCSDDENTLQSLRRSLAPIQKRSSLYLK